jgi:hypothetical protein
MAKYKMDRSILEAALRGFEHTLGINAGAIIDHEAPRERRFVAVQK